MPRAVISIPAEDSLLEIKSESSAIESTKWWEVVGATSFNLEGGAAETRNIDMLQGTEQKRGNIQPPNINFDAKFLPQHISARLLNEAFEDNHVISVRFTSDSVSRTVDSVRRIAIDATTGLGTISGGTDPHAYWDPDQWPDGVSVIIGSGQSAKVYVVHAIQGDGTSAKPWQPVFLASDISANQAATAFTAELSGIQLPPFDCSVTLAGRPTVTAQGEWDQSVQLAAVNAKLPAYVVQSPS